MNPRKRRRLYFALALVAGGAGAAALVVAALQDSVLYFYSPSDVLAKHVAPGVAFRIGGLVEKHSFRKIHGTQIRFTVTDGKAQVPVTFDGVLPALFRENQGVVAMGSLTPSGTFEAEQVLATTTLHGNLPEPLRVAHLIAGGVTTGTSRGRA